MSWHEFIGVTAATIIATEILLRSPLVRLGQRASSTANKSLRVVASRRISDHWKEKVLPRYSRVMLAVSSQSLLWILLCAGAFCTTYALVCAAGDGGLRWVPSWPLTAAATVVSIGYVYFRVDGSVSQYSRVERLLHHVALGNDVVRELSFDLESALCKSSGSDARKTCPVFVCGLARSGTSVLMRTLYGEGSFVSLTYRDMPFVLAPNYWQMLSRWSQRAARDQQRAHGDGLSVNFDTPEAFEEVFWMTFCYGYVHDDHLVAHHATPQTIERFRRFMAHVVEAHGDPNRTRYLSKNNNNLLRLPALRETFPDSRVIIPFRNPLDHASSLLRQHRRFCGIHARDRFAAKYMSWLGHHEFGSDFRPLVFPGPTAQASIEQASNTQRSREALDAINYWLDYWTRTYQYVAQFVAEHGHEAGCVLFDYDRFRRTPGEALRRLSGHVDVPSENLARFAVEITSPESPRDCRVADQDLLARAQATHRLLTETANHYGLASRHAG